MSSFKNLEKKQLNEIASFLLGLVVVETCIFWYYVKSTAVPGFTVVNDSKIPKCYTNYDLYKYHIDNIKILKEA